MSRTLMTTAASRSVGRATHSTTLKALTKSQGRTVRPTSKQAASSVAAYAPVLRQQVLSLLGQHPAGLTDDEGGYLMGGERLTFGRRRCELVKMGLVVDSGQRRPTPAGRSAIVWKLVSGSGAS